MAKVTRKVDTIIMEMDVNTAERLAVLIGASVDETWPVYMNELLELHDAMGRHDAVGQMVRIPSPLYEAKGNVTIVHKDQK